MTTTFWKLLTNDQTLDIKIGKIVIPQIQRDYAQGRLESDVKEKREKFLEAIFKHLTDGNSLHLDFVYGKIEEKDCKDDSIFYPIDGQQRLTTLFLLHWYFGTRESKFAELENLKKFSYDTRPDSRDFCAALIDNAKIIFDVFNSSEKIVDKIRDFSWFKYGWENDPTISSMLIMIEAIHNKFSALKGWSKLVDEDCITFEVLDLGKSGFELTDELYIKMNARGKQLTSFENFKADFIEFLTKTYKTETYDTLNGKKSYSDYFSDKIEKEWCDLFWAYRGDLSTSKSPIDNKIMNFISVIAQLCFFKDNTDKSAADFNCTLENIKNIFNKKENIDFLFFALNYFHTKSLASNNEVSKNVLENYFSTLFFVKARIYDDAVNLVWNLNSTSLFSQCLDSGLTLDARNKILLYCMISFVKNNPNGNLNYYLRVIRNLLYARRQRKETKYNTNIRIDDFGKYWKLFNQLQVDNVYDFLSEDNNIDNGETDISEDSLKQEIQKANLLNETNKNGLFALEDYPSLCGYLNNFDLQHNAEKLNSYALIVPQIFGCKDQSLVIRALIASGFDGLYIRDCGLGENYYFGKDWETILTGKTEDYSINIVNFLDNYLLQPENPVEKKLQGLIDLWLEKNKGDRTWRYYFLKYEEFTNNSTSNYYCWQWASNFKIQILGSDSWNTLIAYHINPFVYTVCKQIRNSAICSENDCYARYGDEAPLYFLKNKNYLQCTDDGWIINNLDGISKELLEKYGIDEAVRLLKPNGNFDMIQIVVAFLKDLHS